jgi:hypothetical protein
MSKFIDGVNLCAGAVTLGALVTYVSDNLKLPAISRVGGPDVVEVKTRPVENHYDSGVASRISGVAIPVEGTAVWEFYDGNGNFVAVPQRQIPKLSQGDFVTIEENMPGRPYQALKAHKD